MSENLNGLFKEFSGGITNVTKILKNDRFYKCLMIEPVKICAFLFAPQCTF